MLKSKESSAPKRVKKISNRTAKRARSNGSAVNKKLVAKRKIGIRKANYNSRNIRNANRVFVEHTPVGGIRGALLSAAIILSVLFTKKSAAKSTKVVSQTDGKKSTRKVRKENNNSVMVLLTLPNGNSLIVLVTLPNTNKVITAVLKIPRSYKLRADWARARINACSGNLNIVIAPATITAYLALVAAFVTAQTNMQTGTKGLKPIRDNSWKAVENALKALMAVAQAAANTSPLTAITIIESGLFFVKSVNTRKATVYNVSNTNTLGTMKVVAPGASRIAFHIWEKSVDGVVWTSVGTSHKTRMSYGGFTPVSKVWVRHRVDTNGVFTAWQYFYVTVN